MFQSFDVTADGSAAADRVAALRAQLAEAGVAGVLVPRGDAHQGETVVPHDERLAWLTGFTGSAGMAVILPTRAALFVDGRYTLQAASQTDEAVLEIVETHRTKPAEWLAEALGEGEALGFDPWLHGHAEIAEIEAAIGRPLVALAANPVDAVWQDQPPPPLAAAWAHPEELAGESAASKRARIAGALEKAGEDAAVLTAPDSIAWLLNIRGADIARTPVAHAFAVVDRDARVRLFIEPDKVGGTLAGHLGETVSVEAPEGLVAALEAMGKGTRVRVDARSCPVALSAALERGGADVVRGRDPCLGPKAVKTAAELDGIRAAHRRDALAYARFLHWLDGAAPGGGLTEIDVVEALERFRDETGALLDISFDTICGAGEHGAIVHYRVTRATNRAVRPGDILLVDSGGQYRDGTTDITRTLAIGPVPEGVRTPFTLVLKGMIAVSRARFPKGTTGRDIDVMARMALWRAGLDYDHGTGHGVGAYLGVHEGPQSLSRRGDRVALEPGMVVSNEPGYYREGAFGIRIETLCAVTPPSVPDGGEREMMGFETLTLAPIDRRLVRADLLDREERGWLDAYHARIAAELRPDLPGDVAGWLEDRKSVV